MAVRRADVVVLGGGISGLASAFYLTSPQNTGASDRQKGHKKIVLLEGSPRIGGWIHSNLTPEGAVHERGTRSIRPAGIVGKNTLDLVSAIGIEDQVVPVTRSHPATQNRFIYTPGGLHRLPSSLGGLVRQQTPFSQSLAARLAREPFAPRCHEEDETIHDFFSRRLGREVAEFLADPFCRGIFAGNSRELSMKACFPALFDAERKYGSIILGSMRSKPEKVPDVGKTRLAQQAAEEKWASWTLTNGLQTLPNKLSDWLIQQGVEVHSSTPCVKVEFGHRDEGDLSRQVAQVTTEDAVWEAEHIICSTSSQVAQALLPAEHSRLSDLLSAITSCAVAVVNLEFDDLRLPVNGFGYLVPSSVPSKILGVVFDSCAFPELDRRKDPTTRLTCMMGGAWFNELFGDPNHSDLDDLLHSALEAIKNQMGINQQPAYAKVNILHDCIPHYKLGHTKLVDDIQSYIKDHRLPLTLVGASYRGVSVNDCIMQARQAVQALDT
ncbi:protoporphyrinogen oxidase-like [Diadema setosum]|uniref:protoporphyrinogen oxidase-like n=1 Tax=Diadema setosum TaxID=31175 RepID=UPI003B3BDBF7